jgi:hypothetical protein
MKIDRAIEKEQRLDEKATEKLGENIDNNPKIAV